jgi:acetolactate synthase-1/2/3 large subunit
MNGAQALFKALTDAGLDTWFANPGTSEIQLVYEMGRTENVSAVLRLEEGFHYNHRPRWRPVNAISFRCS